MASFRMGSAAGTDIPIEHLDYDYVGKCSSASELEEILKALRWVAVSVRTLVHSEGWSCHDRGGLIINWTPLTLSG